MADFTLRQLELFAALPDYPTLSAAASALHISEPALSQAVTGLEKSVGEQLCVRRKAKGLQLTPAGQFFAVRARRLLKEAGELSSELAGLRGRLRGPVRLGCYTGLASNVLPPVLEGFPALHPEVDLGIEVGSQDELLAALDAGRLDAAVVYDLQLPAGLQRRNIYETEVMAMLAAGHRLAGDATVDLAALAPEPLIMLDSTPSTANTRLMYAERGLAPNLLMAVPLIELVRALVGRGLGYSLLMSRPNSQDTSTEGRPVVARPLSPRAGVTAVIAVWPEQMALSPRAAAVLDYAAACFATTPAHRLDG
ncbi:LysR family transcriptional regulator [Arthrobacter sp. I2-34]|uniref:LysR family transcriptional regulator n=1 Tax=Arthrobacter hankyongi TaxID=2904801 RepID=A0ABS9L2R0_9MICC|nr:LysR substrate-binding domain-containing protein [Arthrobacter hankyongi]MCG2620956.1 LysR family transcriptional regulator [Arthrobacter hankyongi]